MITSIGSPSLHNVRCIWSPFAPIPLPIPHSFPIRRHCTAPSPAFSIPRTPTPPFPPKETYQTKKRESQGSCQILPRRLLQLGTLVREDLAGVHARILHELLDGGDGAFGGGALEGLGVEGLADGEEDGGGGGGDCGISSVGEGLRQYASFLFSFIFLIFLGGGVDEFEGCGKGAAEICWEKRKEERDLLADQLP